MPILVPTGIEPVVPEPGSVPCRREPQRRPIVSVLPRDDLSDCGELFVSPLPLTHPLRLPGVEAVPLPARDPGVPVALRVAFDVQGPILLNRPITADVASGLD